MERELTVEATKLLKYLIKNKEVFSDCFSASDIGHRKGDKVQFITPCLEELVSLDFLEKINGIFRAPRYKLNKEVFIDYIENEDTLKKVISLRNSMDKTNTKGRTK